MKKLGQLSTSMAILILAAGCAESAARVAPAQATRLEPVVVSAPGQPQEAAPVSGSSRTGRADR